MSSDNADWTEDNIVRLIQLIRDHPVLWDSEDQAHRNQTKRVAAFENIATQIHLSRAEVERKWRVIQAQFRRQRRKMSTGSEETQHSLWFGYQHMQFLRDKNVLKNTKQTCKKARGDDDDDEECGVIPEVSMGDSSEDNTDAYSQIVIVPKDLKSPTKKVSVGKRKNSLGRISRPTKTFRIVQPTTSRTRERDDCDVYAEYVATEIRKLDHRVQLNVKHLINNIIFEAQMGMHDDISTVNAQQTPQT